MIKRLIFDVDGTLIQGVNFVASVEQTLKRIGVYSDEAVRLFLQGIKTYEQMYDNYNIVDYTTHMGNAIHRKMPQEFVTVFFEELKTCIPPRNQLLIDTIQRLAQRYELVLLTNYFVESQLNRLNNMGIGQYFQECYGEHKIKPNKEAYLSACGDKKSNECVMIGDDIYLDITRAKQEGLNTILVNSKEITVDANIGIMVKSVEEISKKLIDKIEDRFMERE